MGKLINRIPGSRLLISSLQGSALRTHVESRGKPLKALHGKLDIKRHSPSILYFYIHTMCISEASVLSRICGCAVSSERTRLTDVISTNISCTSLSLLNDLHTISN